MPESASMLLRRVKNIIRRTVKAGASTRLRIWFGLNKNQFTNQWELLSMLMLAATTTDHFSSEPVWSDLTERKSARQRRKPRNRVVFCTEPMSPAIPIISVKIRSVLFWPLTSNRLKGRRECVADNACSYFREAATIAGSFGERCFFRVFYRWNLRHSICWGGWWKSNRRENELYPEKNY